MTLEIISIDGNLWELTPFQEIYEPKEDCCRNNEVNRCLIEDKKFFSNGICRTFGDYKVRSKAKVLIKVKDYDFRKYNVYYGKGGFYVLIDNKKHFLKDLEISKDFSTFDYKGM